MKFIKLTRGDGVKVRVNFEAIESYFRISGDDFTTVYAITDAESPYLVRETPEEIDEMVGSVWYVH